VADLQQQVKELKGTLPVPGLRVLQIGIDDLESTCEGEAEPAGDGGKLGLGLLAVDQVERGPRGKMIQDRRQLDLFVDLLEGMDVPLQPLVMGKSIGSMRSRPFALAIASPRTRRS
jgi:hypothetical protein